MKVFNPTTKKNQDLFETLIQVFTVCVTNDEMVDGHKGASVYINVSAENEELAKNLALTNEEFMSHIRDQKNFDKKHLNTFKPTGNYVIGKVKYFAGDPRL